MGKNVIIIGGGIIGLCSAYYLQKEGHNVTVIDKTAISTGASFVNAGFITPSHIIPLASPGMMTKGIKWMFNSSSPFYMKPRWDIDFFKWSWYFYKSSTKEKVEKAIPVIKDISVLSRELFEDIKKSKDLGDFQLERKGLLMLFKSEKEGELEMRTANKAKILGLEVSELNYTALHALEPNVEMDVKGAIHYQCDGHTTPNQFMHKMLAYLKTAGVCIKNNEEVIDIRENGGVIKEIITDREVYSGDEVILAAGSWSIGLAKKLKVKLPIEAGKGYSVNVERPLGISIPAILMESKLAVTPMEGFTRFAGTMEFSGINNTIRKTRVEAIANGVNAFYPQIIINEQEKGKVKAGLRPVSPDGLPYIGRAKEYKNLIFATGHAMMGWSLGPATGKLVAEILAFKRATLDVSLFDPNRKF